MYKRKSHKDRAWYSYRRWYLANLHTYAIVLTDKGTTQLRFKATDDWYRYVASREWCGEDL